MNKKYELTTETKKINGHTVYRIKALKRFDTIIGRRVNKGDLGGWVESENNLSQDGKCWLFDDAVGYENSRRTENSVGSGNSLQYGNSRQFGNSWQFGDSQQYGNSWQYGNSRQSGDSRHCVGDDGGKGCILCISPCGNELRTVTVQPDNTIVAGCFHGSFQEFKQAVMAKYGKDYGSYAMCIKLLDMALKCRR